MQIAIIQNNDILKIGDANDLFPNVSFPPAGPNDIFLTENSAMPLVSWEPFDMDTEKLENTTPYIKDGIVYTYVKLTKSPEELQEQTEKARQSAINLISARAQSKLDMFAKTRNYDNMLAACSYATSSNIKLKEEGQRCVDLRDQVWTVLFELFDEISSGTRTLPCTFEDIQSLLPELSW